MSTDFGLRLKTVREEKGLKREDVANKIGTSAAIIGRYERNERTPSIDIAKNIAEALEVSLDYLVGDTTVLLKDKKMMYRLEILQKVKPDYKERILYMLDVMLKDAQNNSLQEKLA
ncbi:MAG: helix-turn-helix transcriptional regulator [Flavobacteriales bacterium]|nr:helix-turn-helix transcriptional regulator [Flavobacteriales bacterium]